MKKPECAKYKVGTLSKKKNWEEENCRSFSTVRHIAHVGDAIRIIEDEVIRSTLVWDESRLRNSRTCVSWVSPNLWAIGSIYGNVSFEFDWEVIVEGKRLYWVEDVKTYQPPVYRILITDKNYDSWDILVPYDETKPEGPLYRDGETWYRNGNYTGEFMVDSDLFLSDCREVIFIDHHSKYCAKNGSACSEMGSSMYAEGPRVLANLIGRGLRKARRLFVENHNDGFQFTSNAISILSKLIQDFTHGFEDTNAVVTGDDRDTLLRAGLILYGEANYDEAFILSRLLGSKRTIRKSFQRILSKFFRMSLEDLDTQLMLRR